MNALIADVLAAMASADFSEREQFGVRLALEEAIINGMKHGNGDDPAKVIRVRLNFGTDEIVAEVEDEGPGFNPGHVPNPLAPENLEQPGGRGVFLMRHYMTTVEYNERGNRVRLCKKRGR